MNKDIVVPSFGESITTVQIGQIHVSNGSVVTEGQDLVDLETDKLNQTLVSPESGIINWKVSSGDVVSIGSTLASIASNESTHSPSVSYDDSIFSYPLEPQEEKEEERKISFSAEVPPSDRTRTQTSFSVPIQNGVRQPMSSVRKTIASRLLDVSQNTAMLTTFQEIDLHRVIAIREEHKKEFIEKFQVKLGFMSFFVSASSKALELFPIVNSSIIESDIITWNAIDIGVAVSTEKGVIVPVLRNANRMTYAEIEKTIDHMAEKARNGKLEIDDIKGGTFTITNGGVFGSLFSTPILNPPQSAILGMHSIQKRAVVVNDEIVIRPMMYVALTYDHRLIDGKTAVTFLATIKKELEDPDRLLLGL